MGRKKKRNNRSEQGKGKEGDPKSTPHVHSGTTPKSGEQPNTSTESSDERSTTSVTASSSNKESSLLFDRLSKPKQSYNNLQQTDMSRKQENNEKSHCKEIQENKVVESVDKKLKQDCHSASRQIREPYCEEKQSSSEFKDNKPDVTEERPGQYWDKNNRGGSMRNRVYTNSRQSTLGQDHNLTRESTQTVEMERTIRRGDEKKRMYTGAFRSGDGGFEKNRYDDANRNRSQHQNRSDRNRRGGRFGTSTQNNLKDYDRSVEPKDECSSSSNFPMINHGGNNKDETNKDFSRPEDVKINTELDESLEKEENQSRPMKSYNTGKTFGSNSQNNSRSSIDQQGNSSSGRQSQGYINIPDRNPSSGDKDFYGWEEYCKRTENRKNLRAKNAKKEDVEDSRDKSLCSGSSKKEEEDWDSCDLTPEKTEKNEIDDPLNLVSNSLTESKEKEDIDNRLDSVADLEEVDGDLFTAPEDYSLGHCVAKDFNMGSGIALTFRNKFNRVGELLNQKQTVGGLAVLKVDNRFVYYLVTKERSRGKPTLETLFASLLNMRKHIIENDVKNLALPRIGCGLDNLDWTDVKSMLNYLFEDVKIKIVIYNFNLPVYTSPQGLNKSNTKKCNVRNVLHPIIEIEEYTIIIYPCCIERHHTDTMKQLNEKFTVNLLKDYDDAARKMGDVIKTTQFKCDKYMFYGCVVKENDNDFFNYDAFEKCLRLVNKENRELGYSYVAIEAFDDRKDKLALVKVTNIMRNTLREIEVYICYPKGLERMAPRERISY